MVILNDAPIGLAYGVINLDHQQTLKSLTEGKEWAGGPLEVANRSKARLPRVTGVKHLRNYMLELTFSDGSSGRVD